MIIHILTVSRDTIESAHSNEVALLRSQYSDKDKEIIQKFLQAKKYLKQEVHAQEPYGQTVQKKPDQENTSGNYLYALLSLFSTFPLMLVYAYNDVTCEVKCNGLLSQILLN